MILVLGASGYVGRKICEYLDYQKIKFDTFSIRFDITIIDKLDYICRTKPISGIINCSAYTGTKSIDDCDVEVAKTTDANVFCTWNIVDICKKYRIPLVHVSTGCIFDGNGNWDESVSPFFDKGVYNSTKIEAEKIVSSYDNTYICRLRLPFDYVDHPKNLLSKLIKFNTVGDTKQSMTNLSDFALIVSELINQKKPYGIYNIVNPGSISMNGIKTILTNRGLAQGSWTVLSQESEQELFKNKARTTLSSIKVQNEGFILDDIELSINRCIDNWNLEEKVFW